MVAMTEWNEHMDKWIQYEGRDSDGNKMYFVHYEGRDIGMYQTYDEAVIALRDYMAAQ
jgi:hypothetical protein